MEFFFCVGFAQKKSYFLRGVGDLLIEVWMKKKEKKGKGKGETKRRGGFIEKN